jgi:hypothetical protein
VSNRLLQRARVSGLRMTTAFLLQWHCLSARQGKACHPLRLPVHFPATVKPSLVAARNRFHGEKAIGMKIPCPFSSIVE